MQTMWDFFTILKMTKIERAATHTFIGVLETLKLTAGGTQKMALSMAVTADCLVAGGREKLVTPMYLMIARKPIRVEQ